MSRCELGLMKLHVLYLGTSRKGVLDRGNCVRRGGTQRVGEIG